MDIRPRRRQPASQPVARVTLADVAQAAGVDKSTASRALRGDPVVNEATRERLQQVALHLGYVPDANARRLSLSGSQAQTNILALTSPVLQHAPHDYMSVDRVLMELLPIITTAVADEGYDLLLFRPGESYINLQPYERIIGGRHADGVLLVGIAPYDPRLDYLCAKRFPHVLYGRSDRDVRRALRYPYPWVEIDNQLGACRATEYLLSLGHRRIALIGTEQLQDDPLICTADRLQGYRRALKTAHIPYDPALFIPSALTEEEGYQIAQLLFAFPDPPTAVFAADIVAAGVIRAAQDAGKQVGQHFSVVGCDGLDLGRVLRPSLTTLSLPFARIGQQLVTLLVHQVRGEEIEEKHIIVEPELLIRDSTTLA